MKVTVEPKQASNPGGMRLPRAHAVYVKFVTGGVYNFKYTTAAYLPHVPRWGKPLGGVRCHGVGLSRKPLQS